ncbi:MAG: AI-2E family transporter [Nocardioides sp.]
MSEKSDDPPTAPAEPRTGTPLGVLGKPLARYSAFYVGFVGALGASIAWWLFTLVLSISSALLLIVVALFLASGLNPAVEFFMRRGLKRSIAVLIVISLFVGVLAGFVSAIVPVIGEQIAAITANAPSWLDQLQNNSYVQSVDRRFDVLDKIRDYLSDGDWAVGLFGGVVGIGVKIFSTLANALILIVLTLYFLSSLPQTKSALYQLAPASRRERVRLLGDRIIKGIGGYVSGAFLVALCAGVSSLIFLFVVGLGEYAVALAFVVALLDIIPMIGATLGAVVVSLIGFAVEPRIGVACVVFYLAYQQIENYVIYPRVMSRAVEISGVMTVIAALVGASLLGVVGALLAIPTAAAILLLFNEIFVKRQDQR